MVEAEGAENGLEFTIVRPFNWIGPRMDFIPGIDGPSEGVPRVLACFSNVSIQAQSNNPTSFCGCSLIVFFFLGGIARTFLDASLSSLWMVESRREPSFTSRMLLKLSF